jgi:hypothetical protein
MIIITISLLNAALAVDTWDPHYISCTGFPDGYHEYGCWGKAVCQNGQPVVTKCAEGQMFDWKSDACVRSVFDVISDICYVCLSRDVVVLSVSRAVLSRHKSVRS